MSLYEAGFSDLLGVLSRLVLEYFFVGEYLILAPEEAYGKLTAAHKDQLSKMSGGGWKDMTSILEAIPQNAQGLNLHDVMLRVGKCSEDWGDTGAVERMKKLYEVIYRGESLMNVHVGIGSLTGHIDESNPSYLMVREIRREPDDPAHTIRMASVLVGTLAHDVALQFGINGVELARLTNQLGGVASQT